tara:strand:- start:216 stop:392 length:177 start_codon:yes stop_codon:yes gene_type:complete
MSKDKLLEVLKEILGTCEDAYSCCPEGDICTDTSDTMYYIDHARDELEKLIIKLENNA